MGTLLINGERAVQAASGTAKPAWRDMLASPRDKKRPEGFDAVRSLGTITTISN
jgi:hypothetical protein